MCKAHVQDPLHPAPKSRQRPVVKEQPHTHDVENVQLEVVIDIEDGGYDLDLDITGMKPQNVEAPRATANGPLAMANAGGQHRQTKSAHLVLKF